MFELWKKTRELDKINKFYDTEIEKARKEKKSSGEIDTLITEMFGETEFIEQEIKALVSSKLVSKAERLFLPVPQFGESGMWEKGDLINRWYLTPKGITEIRGLIREETSARRKAVLEWVAPFIGIIGAITGLLAVIFAMT